MAFTVHPNPDHVQYPDGTWDERGDPLDALKKAGLPANFPHHVEVDGDTGLVGYTRLTAEEAAENAARAAAALAEQEAEAMRVDARLAMLRSRAKDDPGFAALLEQLGLA